MFTRQLRPMLACILATLLASGTALAVDPPAADAPDTKTILKQMGEKYKSMATYRSTGTMATELELSGQTMTDKGEFTMALQKPDRYRITWTKSNSMMPSMKQTGAVWSDGTDRKLFIDMGPLKGGVRQKEDGLALGAAGGLSGGVALGVPSLFFDKLKRQSTMATSIKEPKLEGTEKVGEVECYVISGPSRESAKETVWIAKDSHLVLKYSRSLEQPEGPIEVTDEEAEQIAKQMGQEVTEESKAKARETVNQLRERMRQMGLKGTLTETHTDVSSPKLKDEDFKYEVPEGTEFKDSLKELMPASGAGAF